METVEKKNSVYRFIRPEVAYAETSGCITFEIPDTEAIHANAYYFSHTDWAQEYLDYCHRDAAFIDRWKHATGSWTDKIVVDIGCGPGNIQASLQQDPALLIGVDVAPGSLRLAQAQGYVPVRADAHDLPFVSGFADIVILNAALHHCEHMEVVLKEAARLVKPGGVLVTDHDPQISAWDYKGPALFLWNFRLKLYKLLNHSFHKEKDQQLWALRSEIHHQPKHGVSTNFFQQVLGNNGFDVRVYPHNHTQGRAIFAGHTGKAELKYMIGNILSGRNPFASTSALSLMCVATKKQA